MKFLIVTGMSGAGKTVAVRHLEDLGALCVDNLPPVMLVPFMESCKNISLHKPIIAIAADVRSGEFFDARAVTTMIDEARSLGYVIDTLFMDASDEVLVNRYKETRRDHPLSEQGMSLEDAIREEREKLQPLKETATHLIDTSSLRPKALQKALSAIVLSADQQPAMSVEVMSFGFKRGLPRDSDLVFDVRFLPNPFYIAELCRHTGLDEDVRHFVIDHPITQEFLKKNLDMLSFLIPHYITEGKHRLVIAIGCTGGAHRSVAIAEYIAHALEEKGWRTSVNHRDIALEQAHWETRTDMKRSAT